MNQSVERIILDVQGSNELVSVEMKQGDTARTLEITLADGGFPYKIAQGCYAVFTCVKPDGNGLFNSCRIENNAIIYDVTEQTTASAGKINAEIRLYGPDDKVLTSARFRIFVNGTVFRDEIAQSTSEFSALSKLIYDTAGVLNTAGESVRPFVEQAEKSAANAEKIKADVEALRSELEKDYPAVPELNNQVDGLKKELIQSDGLNIAAAYGRFLPESHNGITYSWNEDHTECTVNGTAAGLSFNNFISTKGMLPHGITENSEIYFDVHSTSADVFIRIYFYNDAMETLDFLSVYSPQWVKIPEGTAGMIVRVQVANGATVTDAISVKIYRNLPNSLLGAEIGKRIYSKAAQPYISDNSLTLGDIREDGFYTINTSLAVTDAPTGFKPTGLTVVNYSVTGHGSKFVKQTIEDLLGSSDKRYHRYSNADGVFGEWKEETAPVTNNNSYTINQYTSNNTVSCNPTITTDANNFLAAPDDGRDMTGAIQAMLDTTGVCRLGPGVFRTTGVNIPTGGMLAGSGNHTRLVLADGVTSGYAVKINTYGCVQNLMIGGTESDSAAITGLSEVVGDRHGILFQGAASTDGSVPKRSTVHNVTIYNFTGGGITCTDTGYNYASCLNVSDVYIFWCGAGINIPYRSEFNRFTNVSADRCYYGCVNNGGNNVFANCGFSGNTVGVLMDNSTGQSPNNSHGTYTGCVFNHSGGNTGTAIKLLGIKAGELFNACQLFYGGIVIDGCEGVRLDCFNAGSQAPISISNSKGIVLNGWIVRSESDTPVTKDDSVVIVSNCYTRAGAPFAI